jgi:hypothetical protein
MLVKLHNGTKWNKTEQSGTISSVENSNQAVLCEFLDDLWLGMRVIFVASRAFCMSDCRQIIARPLGFSSQWTCRRCIHLYIVVRLTPISWIAKWMGMNLVSFWQCSQKKCVASSELERKRGIVNLDGA